MTSGKKENREQVFARLKDCILFLRKSGIDWKNKAVNEKVQAIVKKIEDGVGNLSHKDRVWLDQSYDEWFKKEILPTMLTTQKQNAMFPIIGKPDSVKRMSVKEMREIQRKRKNK